MRTAVLSLTGKGAKLAVTIGSRLNGDIFVKQEYIKDVYTPEKHDAIHPVSGSFKAFTERIFSHYDALVFIMASGIVVRAIAPLLQDKTTDPAVLVLDEKGENVISLLSGHIGGANDLARKVAAITGGKAVITTATDVNEVMAFDNFAVQNDCAIENIKALKYISSAMLDKREVVLFTQYSFKGGLPQNIRLSESSMIDTECMVVLSNSIDFEIKAEKALILRPRNLILGIGCRRGTPSRQISQAVEEFLEMNKKSRLSVKHVATIDIKKDEAGLLEFCKDQGLELKIVPGSLIKPIEDDFTGSVFVKEKVGVASVAEPCAVLSGRNAKLICKKTAYSGITLALAEEETVFAL